MAGEAGLRGEANGRIGGAKDSVAAPLHDLEKESAVEIPGVSLEVLAVALAVVEHVIGPQAPERIGRQVDAGVEIVIVVFRDRQQVDAARAQALDGRKDIVGRKSDVLDAGAEQVIEETRGLRVLALRSV